MLDGFTRIVRLGEGVSQTGELGQPAMDRTIEALRQCRNKLAHHEPRRMRLIATEACRAAVNSSEFLDRVRDELGLELEIVDRRTEAELAVTGCADLIESSAKGALMFDIGGGSSELAWLDFRGGRPRSQGRMAASIRSWQSLPVGVVSIAETFGGTDVTPEIFEAMVAHVSAHLANFRGREKLRQMIAEHPMHLIGTSGTVTTLAGLHLGLERYERAKVDGLWMRNEEIVDTMRVLLRHDLCGPLRPSLHRPRPRRSRHPRLRHIRGDPPRMADRPHSRRRPRPARRHPHFAHGRGWGVGRRARPHPPQAQEWLKASNRQGPGVIPTLKTRVKTAKGRKISSTLWLQRQLNDPYVRKAQAEGYRSRAAYKLIEINDKHKLLKPGMRVIDLGCAPGGWLQVAVREVRSSEENPLVVGIDYLEMDPVPGSIILQKDFNDEDAPAALIEALGGHKADLVLSDMAAPTTGHKATDHLRIIALVELAADFAGEVLRAWRRLRCQGLPGRHRASASGRSQAPLCHNLSRQAACQPLGFGRGLSRGERLQRLERRAKKHRYFAI